MQPRRAMTLVGRRGAVAILGGLGLAALPLACGGDDDDAGVTPAEDLMREHGALNRVLLVYEECARRLEGQGPPCPPDVLASGARIIRTFIEDYHEKLEEDFLFPRFEKAGKLIDLVATLRLQHRAGRRLTAEIEAGATSAAIASDEGKRAMVTTLRSFARMYRPHEAREDTVLFPALRAVASPKELLALGEQFEAKEHKLFGKEGFEGVVVEVAALEAKLGIADLGQFTP